MAPPFVIVGASLAGATAAATLRQDGFDGDIILIGAEPHPPYERPPLSKQYLRGEAPFEKSLVRPVGFYEQHHIETRFGVRATHVNPDQRTAELDNGDRVIYEKLLIATGVRNRRPPIPGLDLPGVFSVAARNFLACYLKDGRLDAVVALNRGKDVRRVMPLIKSRSMVDPVQLADESVDVRSLLRG